MKWFKHDANAILDSKLKKLKLKYGMEGYGLYWYCLECIARTVEPHNLTFVLEEDSELISADTGIHYERVEEMMRYMVQLNLFEQSGGIITCLKMASRADEYTQKLLRKDEGNQQLGIVPTVSRQCPDKVPPIRIEQKRTEKKTSSPKNKFSDEDMKFAIYMKDKIEAIGYSDIKTNINSWANTIRLMRERDKVDRAAMLDVFDWANNDSFWSANIRSAEKFREQYQQLKVKKASKHGKENDDDKYERLRQKYEAA